MVFFGCNACGDTIKKNQAEKHLIQCHKCVVLTCLDCCKDFQGEEYQTHIKCISEEEKPRGNGYRGSAFEAAKKQPSKQANFAKREADFLAKVKKAKEDAKESKKISMRNGKMYLQRQANVKKKDKDAEGQQQPSCKRKRSGN